MANTLKQIKKLMPMFDRVLVLRDEIATKTKAGIMIPEKAQNKEPQGTIVAVGPGARNEKGEFVPPQLSVGDKVLLPKFGGTKVDIDDDKDYQLFREKEILAKLAL